MTGLDKIIAQIKADCDSVCADITSKADARCESIIREASNDAERIITDGKQKAQEIYDETLLRAKSSADLEIRSVILSAKQDIISSSLDEARKYLCKLPEEEYFDLIYKMISKYSEASEGEICLSKKDIDRLPANFLNRLSDVSKGSLSICREPVNIDGGFILIYGGIEVNCSFASLFSANSEAFSDEISKLLFV